MESFVEECMKTYSAVLKKDIDDKFNKLQSFTKQTIKSDIMTKINDSSNYDYKKLPDVDTEKIKSALKFQITDFSYIHLNYNSTPVLKFFDNILLMKTEKVFFCNSYIAREVRPNGQIKEIPPCNICISKIGNLISQCGMYGYTSYYKPYNIIILTNYGRLLILNDSSEPIIKEYNTWLPLNYIELINVTKPFNIIEVMDKITNELYLATYTTNDDTLHKVQVENNELTETNKIQKSKLQQLELELKSVSTQHTILQQKINSMKQILL